MRRPFGVHVLVKVVMMKELTLLLKIFVHLLSLLVSSCAQHTSNHAVIVSSSRYWFNYRHNANALTIYQFLKENGFRDENIILMLADEYAVNPRNVFKNRILTTPEGPSLYDASTEVDYRGEDVTVSNLVHALTGHHTAGLPVLNTDEKSNILIYLTGHGGDQFFKFQDVEEIMTQHLSAVFQQMHAAKRYHEILFVADTCQAFTLGDAFISPNITVIGSSLRKESSYAHHADENLGLSVIERYTYAFHEFLRNKDNTNWGKMTLRQAMVDPFPFEQQRAHIGISDKLAVRKADQVVMSDFWVNKHIPSKRHTKDVVAYPIDYEMPRFSLEAYQRATGIDYRASEKQQKAKDDHANAQPTHSLIEGADPSDGVFLLLTVLLFGMAILAGFLL
ncbi:phosphatidylinositol glycan, class K [Fistulifera solaris]|uniref:Phosphatidylinositol glycan, class K n=1 Tax=Fistulifera solaris TaxID=1519565 RepID=A0A1Z5JRA7_FISSO|nr:phosphatidylinositol glycan, class K [Fistulifera solaris]|eukprot:GAX16499.1 phosphatidylinositol glycan, class K [Fistulifera solaris]